MFLVDYKPSLQRELDRKEGYEDGFSEGEIAGFSKGEAAGFSKGEAAGFSKGEACGMKKGEYLKLIALIHRKIQKEKTLEQIADELEEPAEKIAPFYDLLQKHNKKTDEEIYYLYQKERGGVL